VETACEIDSIVLQHQKLSINAVENKTPIRSRDFSLRFFSKESSPKPAQNQNRAEISPRQVHFVPNNQLTSRRDNQRVKCNTCNRLGHIVRNCFVNNNYRPNFRRTSKRLSRGTNYSGYAARGNRAILVWGNDFGFGNYTRGSSQIPNQNFQRNTYQYRGRTNQPNNDWNRNT